MVDNKEKLKAEEIKSKELLLDIYCKCKSLFIKSEELISEMYFFPAPTIEHRDALEHVARYMEITKNGDVTPEALKELQSAIGHEYRAYFDTADYICVMVRKEINESLKNVSRRKIKRVWNEYTEIKSKILDYSDKIADIRINRKGNHDCIEQYEDMVQQIIDFYKDFLLKIQPKL